MIRTAIAGLGWWGRTLVESVDDSALMTVVAAAQPRVSPEIAAFIAARGLRHVPSVEDLAKDDGIDAVILATPPSGHAAEVTTLARAGKHVFCEKPFTYDKASAAAAVAAVEAAGVALGIGFNRRFHPEMEMLRQRIRSGGLGVLEHIECIMTVPNALFMPKTAWRAKPEEAPCGALAPLGVHAIDAFIQLAGEIDTIYCQSTRRAVDLPTDDTTSALFRMRSGASAYLGMMMATAPAFVIQAYGSNGWVRLDGMTHVAGASSEERRTGLFAECRFQPVKGEAETWTAARVDTARAGLEAFARAAAGGPAFPITPAEIVHGAAATEALIRSAATGQAVRVE
ncbi:Gfo/Idh/MocA family oxidoreductase [Rhodoplanes sp. TEM]|uniref:Gfo/Idh/MocA family oxidoreductase n=1 Tax=Rhodoplanes tepidamans TaxID=200616 RepID=A0ABT5J4R2_RHOTP|nr:MULTISPECIES: Gfo/Idh/MocA family oxidoreductase [Rhodoplanes]MDC7784630.1 Gfo/Idh/MocA family oxidoreductase [Rhodoplanes tepidamans]MDC7982922.1 Gfo/Idh/MocA family oxidoreductase [Rhodoplanes sp. TEM]MDQ0355858.1 putative dehydrogenase [Rhodoplanes tepidamans]